MPSAKRHATWLTSRIGQPRTNQFKVRFRANDLAKSSGASETHRGGVNARAARLDLRDPARSIQLQQY